MAKFLKFFFEYQSLLGETHRVEIWEEGTTTATIELQAGAEPFVTENNNDVAEKYLGGIVPTVATVMMSATETFNSSYFSKQKYGDYILKFRVNGALRSNAIITPFEANDLDRNGGYPITLSAECGLRNLKNKKYTTTGTRIKLISVLKNCLAQIGFIDNFPIKVIDNTKCYDGSIFDAVPTKYWEAYCDDIDFEGLNCYEVIDRIRKPYNQVFFDHVNGCWFVRNVDEISSQNSTIRTYSWADLSFTDLSYNRPTKAYIDRQNGSFGRMFSHQSVVVKKAKSKLKIRNTWGSFDNLTGWTYSGAAGLFYVINNGRLYNSKSSFSTQEAVGVDQSYIQSPQFLYTPFSGLEEKEKLTIEADVEMGSVLTNLRMQIITGFNGPGGIANFLSTDGNWYTVENDQVPSYEQGQFFGTPIYEAKPSGGKLKIEIPTPPYHANNEWVNQLNNIGHIGYWNNPFMGQIPLFPEFVEYYLIIRIFFPERGISESATNTSTDAAFGLYIDNLSIRASNQDPDITEGFERKFTLEDTQDRETDLTVDLGIGWPSYPTGTDSLFKTTADSSLVKFYSKSNVISGEAIDVFVSNSYLKVLGKRLQTYQGTIWESLGFGDLVGIMGVKYRLHNAKYNARMHNTEVKAVELATNSTSTIDEETLQPNEDEKLIEEKIDRAVNRIDIPEFSSVNFAKKVLPSGKSVIMMNPDMRMDSAFADKFYAKSVTGGIITTEAEDTDEDFLHIKPAANGTYALEEWVTANAWMQGGNTVTAEKPFGTIAGNFDIPILRNNVEVGRWRSGGLTVPALNISGLNANQLTATDASKNIVSLDTATYPSLTELTYLKGVTSSIQTQINGKLNTPTSLTTNFVTKWSGTAFANSQIFDNGVNVGIGTNTPTDLLHINAASNGGILLTVGNAIKGIQTSTGNKVQLAWWGGTDLVFGRSTEGGAITNYIWRTGNANADRMTLNATGLGIGVSSPAQALHVFTATPYQIQVQRSGVGSALIGVSGQTANSTGDLLFDGGQASQGFAFRSRDASNAVVNSLGIDRNGNVGIGIFSPAYRLDVSGGARFTNDVVIGGGAVGVNSLLVAKNITGGVDASGIRSSGQIQSDVTNSAFIYRAIVNQANFDLPTLIVYESNIGTISGTGTNFVNYRAAATSAGFTNVYGFQGTIASGTNRWNLFMNGTAQNHFRGNVGIGAGSTVPTTELDVLGITRTTNLRITNGAAVGKVWQCNNVNGTGEWVTPLSSERYIGEWAANSGVAPSASPTTGDYYVVNTAGTYLGITYSAGDEIYWNGTAWLKRSNFLTLPIATSSVLGGIKIGTGLSIDGSGVVSVASLATARTISATGDGTWSVSFNGSADVSGALTLATITDSASGTFLKITRNEKGLVTGTQSVVQSDITGLLGAASITNTMLTDSGVAAGTYRSVTVNAKGIVTGGTNPTTVSGYGITDFFAQVVSGFTTGENSTVLNTDSLEVALEKLQGQINARISGNQTITLSGIVTGSGTTAITTAIADAALSIAKTSGLQTALDGKFATPTGLTTNFVSKWGGSVFANSQIFDNGTSVGIAITSVSSTSKLHVNNAVGNSVRFQNTYFSNSVESGTGFARGGIFNNAEYIEEGGVKVWKIRNIGANDAAGILFGNSGTLNFISVPNTGIVDKSLTHAQLLSNTRITILATGFVGVNTTEPTHTFDVLGTTRTTNLLITSGATNGNFLKCNNVNGTSVWSSITTSDISNLSSWAGSTSITTLGTITAGTWNGTAIATTRGGTGLSAIGTANQMLRVNAGATALEYFTPTFISGNQTISITGDATGSGTTSIALTLANVATAGTYRSVTINNKGLVTSGTNPTTISGYGITDAYTKTESDGRFVALGGSYANPTWITSLAWSKLSGVPATFAPSAHTHAASDITSGVIATARLASGTASATTYLRGDQTWATLPAFVNQTITLSGIVTGSGTTAITTAIADNALSIAKTSGLQTALNSKQATLNGTGFVKASGTTISYDNTNYQPLLPSGNNGQFLVRNATNQLDFMNLVLEPQGLSYNKIAVGDNQNYLSEQQGFEFREESYIAIYKVGSNPIKAFYAGMYSSSNNSFITASGGSLTLKADNGFYLDGFTGSGNRMLAVDTFGRIYHTAIPTGGGGTAVGTLDQVLANGNSSNRNIILNYGGYVSTDKLQFSGESWNIYKRYDGGTGTGIAVSTLSGTGTRMVVADTNGVLSTQLIPSGSGSTSLAATQIAFGSGSNSVTSSPNFIYSNGSIIMTNNSASNVNIIRINGQDGYDRNIFFAEIGGTDNGAFVGYRAGVNGAPDPTMLTMQTVNANNVMGGIAIHRQNGHVYIGQNPNSKAWNSSELNLNKLFVDGNMRVGGNEIIISGSSFKLSYSDFVGGTYAPANGDKILMTYDGSKGSFVMQKIQVYTNPSDSRNYLTL